MPTITLVKGQRKVIVDEQDADKLARLEKAGYKTVAVPAAPVDEKAK